MRFRADSRGQAITIGRAIAGMLMIGVLWALAQPAFAKLRTAGNTHISNSTAVTGQTYVGWMFDYFLVMTLGITILGVIAMAVYQRRGGV